MAHWAKPGAKCVCIEDGWSKRSLVPGERTPICGEIYEIEVVESDAYGRTFLVLSGLLSDASWSVEAFRPLITQSDDIAKFTQLLNTTDEVVSA